MYWCECVDLLMKVVQILVLFVGQWCSDELVVDIMIGVGVVDVIWVFGLYGYVVYKFEFLLFDICLLLSVDLNLFMNGILCLSGFVGKWVFMLDIFCICGLVLWEVVVCV